MAPKIHPRVKGVFYEDYCNTCRYDRRRSQRC
nr:MAG TPA: hypothetical protein [Caudoviricetes sp.]